MERLLIAAAGSLLAAAAFGALGALFGGAVRLLAQLRDRVPDVTPGEAFRNGVRGGAGFLAVLGGLFGVLVAFVEPSAQDSVEALEAGVGTLGLLMLVIGLGIAAPTTALVWFALWYRRRGSPTAAPLVTIAAAVPLVALYLAGARVEGWLRWATWGLPTLVVLGVITWAVRAGVTPLDERGPQRDETV